MRDATVGCGPPPAKFIGELLAHPANRTKKISAFELGALNL